MQKAAAVIAIVAVIIMVGASLYYFGAFSPEQSADNIIPSGDQEADGQPQSGAEEPIGGQTDEHGCLGPAGYTWCEAKSECVRIFEEFCPDQAAELAAGIKDSAGIGLAYQGEISFNWIVNYADDKTADQEISGVLYEAQGLTMEEVTGMENYLNTLAEPDTYNLADGVVGGLRGYQYNYMACILNFRHAELAENEQGLSEPVGDNLNVKLECGYFNPNDIAKIADREAIRELYIQKYKLAPASMKITIGQQTNEHMRGSVAFLDEEGNPASGGYFFAKKTGDDWELVLDGNGQISCQLLRDNSFPEEMMNDCVEE